MLSFTTFLFFVKEERDNCESPAGQFPKGDDIFMSCQVMIYIHCIRIMNAYGAAEGLAIDDLILQFLNLWARQKGHNPDDCGLNKIRLRG
ncbi:hypothetical protein SAMN05192529_10658 [Arachidicoccus rhizosphaerae]|uniref:Uncharacterized protein n=1 Tax=Arachidicoccus rhizosphaerae TaxID=551991 RepID=A0A1H3XT33_9BACT|nr:hypothetical protein [Arachidicoccus rhizosphaerae]SEA01712.1 hypothetical protein SAMN05192529_10658 [Arachidicoccus rhizosphaerae]